jgi:translation initiation factor 4A
MDPALNGQPTEVLTPTAKSGSVSSSSPPQDYLSANFGQYSIQTARNDERAISNLAVGTFRSETISPASSVRSIGPELASFDAHAKASPFLNDILDRLIRCEYANRDIHQELKRIADNVAFLVERPDPPFNNPLAQSQSDELKQLNQRVSALTASVSQLMAIQTQTHLQNMNAGFSAAPSPVTPQLNLLDPPQPHTINRQAPRGPMPVRTWSSGSIDPTGRGLAPESAIRGPDKRRSVTSLIRRDSASVSLLFLPSRHLSNSTPRPLTYWRVNPAGVEAPPVVMLVLLSPSGSICPWPPSYYDLSLNTGVLRVAAPISLLTRI